LLHVITTLLNPVSVFHPNQDLAAYRAAVGGPTGLSSRRRRTPRRVRVPADAWRLSRRLAFWSDISLRPRKVLPFRSRPIPGPEIPAGSPRPKEGPKNYRADHILAQWRLGMGMGYREFSSEGVEIYDHPAHGRNMDSFPCPAREQSQPVESI
jgi:hypothetical protein